MRLLGIDHRWTEVSRAYADVNRLFGRIVKFTPTSKVVGDMALMVTANDLGVDGVCNPDKDFAFPEAVVSPFKGELGLLSDGWSRNVRESEPLVPYCPGGQIPPVDFNVARTQAEATCERLFHDRVLASYLTYPKRTVDLRARSRIQRHVGCADARVPARLAAAGGSGVDISLGRTLLVSLQRLHADEQDGVV